MSERDPDLHPVTPPDGNLSVRADASALRELAQVIRALAFLALALAVLFEVVGIDEAKQVLLSFLF